MGYKLKERLDLLLKTCIVSMIFMQLRILDIFMSLSVSFSVFSLFFFCPGFLLIPSRWKDILI
jgi:hypothetical protein